MPTSDYYENHALLFSPDLLERVVERTQERCRDKDFPVHKGLDVREEAQRAYQIVRSAYQDTRRTESTEGHRAYVKSILTEVLGYDTPVPCPSRGIPAEYQRSDEILPLEGTETDSSEVGESDKLYPVTWMLSCGKLRFQVPVFVVDSGKGLDERMDFSEVYRRLTATQMMQIYLNASKTYRWALVTNGAHWRLLRDNFSLTQERYLDIALDLILQEENRDAFDVVFWRILHFSRAEWVEDRGAESCLWEEWHRDLEVRGARAREGLREGVAAAICHIGTGFLRGRGQGNEHLRHALEQGELSVQDFYRQLMRLAYRLIFLMVLEERHLLHAHLPDADETPEAQFYAKAFALRRLAPHAARREFAPNRHDDLWQAQRIVFRALGQDGGESRLALPGLGGIFSSDQCPHLDACRLPNSAFLTALFFLQWSHTDNKPLPIDYAGMGAEELGSIYESLLELTPRYSAETQSFSFGDGAGSSAGGTKKQRGNARKTSGSYYTPECLVEQVMRTTLDPLLDSCCAPGIDPTEAARRLLTLRIIDPACGSGHFLLAAARRLASRLADLRSSGLAGSTSREHTRAMHDVIRQCIYGVDLNPMAVELVRMNLWLEGYQPGKALSFLDDHLRCGNSLLGVFDEHETRLPIPDAAFSCNPSDSKILCRDLAALNRRAAKSFDPSSVSLLNWNASEQSQQHFSEETPSDVREHASSWQESYARRRTSSAAVAADIRIGAFLVPKVKEANVPTTATLGNFLAGILSVDDASIQAARQACIDTRAFHWFLEFPEVFDAGGFDCVLGNPPWEKMKVQEREWFAEKCPSIASCANTDSRRRMIDALRNGFLPNMPPVHQRELFAHYENALRLAAATSRFTHLPQSLGGRFPLTGIGDVNMFALFAELSCQLMKPGSGRAGIIVPTGIATDDSTSAFFNDLVHRESLQALYDFENKEGLFRDVHRSFKLSILAMAPSEAIDVACYMTNPKQLGEEERHAHLRVEDFIRINPNTGTCPLFRCTADAELSVKVYRDVPILWNERTGENPWGVAFGTMLHMSNDSHLFLTSVPEGEDVLPLYEGKHIYHFDHRFNTFETVGPDADARRVSDAEKQDPDYEPSPRYWVQREDVLKKLPNVCQSVPKWFIGFRNITNATNERTIIMSFFPFSGVGHSIPLIFTNQPIELEACFIANASSLVLDYIVRQKIGGTNLTYFYVKQFPFLPPSTYSEEDIAYITRRVLELTYTSRSMKPLAGALGYGGEPFGWDETRRAHLRAELDAYYARLYHLTREELAYILDPTTRYPKDCPTVTFPGLRRNEESLYGEYRTGRLVLQAYDALTR